MQLHPTLLYVRNRIVPILTGPPILAFLPALTLGAFWLGEPFLAGLEVEGAAAVRVGS